MIVLWVVLGVLVGGVVAHEMGSLVGGILAFLLARVFDLAAQVRGLREEIQHLVVPAPEAPANEDGANAPPPTEPDWAEPARTEPNRAEPAWTEHDWVGDPRYAQMADLPDHASPIPSTLPIQSSSPSTLPGWQTPTTAAQKPALWLRAFAWLTEGNVVAKIGMIVLFFGLGFLLKYATEHAMLPVWLRLVLAGVGASVLLGLGGWLRARHRGYALVLQGGGIGVAYLTVFAAYGLYHLLPATPSLALMLAVVALAAWLAVRQDAPSLAVMGAIGGFLAPILVGQSDSSHIPLFSYYLMLDIGIVLIAWRKAWRLLNLLAFVFTFVVAAAWGVLRYSPALFATTEPFLIAFFLLFTLTAVLYARQRAEQGGRDYVQSSLVFGPPLVGFGLQVALVEPFAYGEAWSALGLGLFYIAFWLGLRALEPRALTVQLNRLLTAFLALGIGFVSLAIPFAFDAQWTSMTWALEGAILLWLGLRQGQPLSQWAGGLLQVLAAAVFFNQPPLRDDELPLLDPFFMAGGLVGLTGLWSAWLLRDHPRWRVPTLIWGLAWWLGAGWVDLANLRMYAPIAPILLFTTVTAAGLGVAYRRWPDWSVLRFVPIGFALSMALLGMLGLLFARNPAAEWGWLAWPLAFVVLFFVLRGVPSEPVEPLRRRQVISQWVALAVFLPLCAEQLTDGWLRLGFDQTATRAWFEWLGGRNAVAGWASTIWGAVGAAALAWVSFARRWLFVGTADEFALFQRGARRLLAAGAVVWLFAVHALLWDDPAVGTQWAAPASWGYWPLLNGPDLATALLFGVFALRWRQAGRQAFAPAMPWLLGALAFFWLNAMLARSVAEFAGVPLYAASLWDSALAQTVYSIAWSLVGLGLIVLASRRAARVLWLLAAALLAVVVLKLFLVDLSNSRALARVVSFLGVGVLLLLAGYFAPMPQKPRSLEDRL